MQCRTLLAVAALGSTVACWAQQRHLLGSSQPVTVLTGSVVSFETGAPIPQAEVCVFGSDTTCVRADTQGRYRAQVRPGTVTVRFRLTGMPPAFVRAAVITAGNAQISCAMSGRLSLADEAPCLSVPAR